MDAAQYLIEVIVGDSSVDGHEKKATCLFKARVKLSAVHRAYAKGTKIVGWDLTTSVATEYEDHYIEKEKLARLRALGYETSNFEEDYFLEKNVDLGEEGKWGIMPDDFFDMWRFIVGLGGVTLEYINPGKLRIGGYGLF